ncbi:hypothetical protein SAMN05414137_11392 [Streptacidiphilus jiangxiensis]|uniref:TadE-like protein n=2 Tax=Streptacidiphilus jiangxiensis TaxID=235985 RepID=A0A1H7T5M0_STRJI|nr:hypothetical protein SAMN05414137_11392 [Streptacidiphilus jiangxiensis]
MLVVQAASFWFDRQVALGAAREGAAVAADTQFPGRTPERVAHAFAARNGLLAGNPVVSVTDDGTFVTVTVGVPVNSVLGSMFHGTASATVTVPVERFVGAG